MLNVVLFEPEIPQNTGNIMRTCVGTNTILHLIKPLGFALDASNIKRSGVNYITNCQYYVYENWNDFCQHNQNGQFYFLTRYGQKPHTSFDYSDNKENLYFIFGRESTGIPKEILSEHLDHCMRMPMTDKIRALNLSNCVAIMIYEVLRQRQYEGLLFMEPFKGADYLSKNND